ncbi:hypothetical protein DAPPUDRAFT_117858 [Daphnia pulex]|uniref:Uncharacterized protein n=1 Tax=Daphnia pulex TaxID=6669 RepID=E9HTZ3_DAPPU|nr:hypothetical protein DAPPUDRAFT_117858 [Daphnia pulex]|eukprot:EFX64788.1 hypothetical protein DAPPUDRAFT_117858 [Daphnia pulex]
MKQIREIMIKELTTRQLQSVPVSKPCVAPLVVTSRIPAVPEYDPHIFDSNSTAGPLQNPSVAGNSRGKSEYRTASATDECHASSVSPKKRKICDNEQIKDFRTSFRIINTAESHVKSLRAQVRELHQQKRRLHKRLLEKNEKLKQYEHIASDRKKEKSMVEELSKRRANKEIMAVLLLNQVENLMKKKFTWEPEVIACCIILHARSPGTVSTLRSYIGKSTGGVGFTPIAEKRLTSLAAILGEQEKEKNYPFFRPYRNLADKHTNPNTLDRMKVRFAYDVYSDEIIATFELFKTYGAEGFTNEGQHIRKRLAVKKHFTKSDDPRLRYLEETLQNYLEKWKDHTVKTRNSQGFLSKETYEALIFTCKSTAACVRYLLQERKFKFVLTRRFSTDNIERMFGAIRSMCGGNNKWDFTKSFGLTFATVPLRATYQ